MSDPLLWLMFAILVFLCWPWPKDESKKLQLRRIEEKLDALLKHLKIESPVVNPEVVQLTAAGKKIEAVKLYRDLTGASLKEAKAFVESL